MGIEERISSLTPEQRAALLERLGERRRGEIPESVHAPAEPAPESAAAAAAVPGALDFSLFFFSARASGDDEAGYGLLLDAARFADEHGFHAVWVPERHFDEFGGLYPSPSVLGAAVASVTRRIDVRAGSVVLPLNNPVRVAEEWAVIDNLSRGRAGVSFASGWHPNDFVLAPSSYESRKDLMMEGIETIRALWSGKRITLPGAFGDDVELRIFPLPVQAEVPIWITSSGNPETWDRAAAVGANVLTALLEQTIEEVAEKVTRYRKTLADHGFDPSSRRVTLMVHTFVGGDLDEVISTVREPLTTYLRSHISLFEKMVRSQGLDIDLDSFSEADKQALAAFGFDRYTKTSALIGTPESCSAMLQRIAEAGVDEVASLIDFGVDPDAVFAGLEHLDHLRELWTARVEEGA